MTEGSKAVFLSYASQDAGVARRISDALRSAGIEVWFDQSELRGGDAWDRQIRKNIQDCALFMPIISRTTQARLEGYFRREWRLAVDRTHDMADGMPFLVPIVIDDTSDQHAEVPEAFRGVQWTRLPEGATPVAFVERVARLLSPGQPQASAIARKLPGTKSGAAITSQDPARAASLPRSAVPLIAAIAILAGGYFALDRLVLSNRAAETKPAAASAIQATTPTQSAIPEKSIAVLPFVDMSEKKDQEYFSDGLSEELIDHLAHSADLKVIARTSSFQFKGKNEDVRTIAAKLGVANVLEGSVRTAGHAVRVTAQLIRASDGTHLWSESYDRQMSDIFKVQDEIAATVVKALKATLTSTDPNSANREQNLEAYNLLLKGNFFYQRSHPGDAALAIEQYKQALQLDPNYALAWAKLARVYIVAGPNSTISVADAESKARDALQRALTIDPNLPVAHRWLGRIYLSFRWDWPAAKREFERATALDPNGAEGSYAFSDGQIMTALVSGRFEDAIHNESQNLARSPLDTQQVWVLGWILFYGGHLEEAAVMQRRLLELDPAYEGAHYGVARTLLLMGKKADALAEGQKETDEESRLLILGLAYWAMGRKTDADTALRELESKFASTAAYDIGTLYAYRGDADAAATRLERAYGVRDRSMVFLKCDPLLRNLWADARYKSLLRKMKMMD